MSVLARVLYRNFYSKVDVQLVLFLTARGSACVIALFCQNFGVLVVINLFCKLIYAIQNKIKFQFYKIFADSDATGNFSNVLRVYIMAVL